MSNFKGFKNFKHGENVQTGILICNLGTPDAATSKAVRRYLAEFLSDPRIVELPRFLWLPLLHGIILNVRPKRSAKAYAKIWTDSGSPLLLHSQNLRKKLENSIDRDWLTFELGMRYGNPSIETALDKLIERGARQILVVPLYPQYAAATTASVYDAVFRYCAKLRWIPQLRFTSAYHREEKYISALVETIKRHWEQHGKSERFLFSFHGIPKSTFLEGDPYHCQCLETARLVIEELDIDPKLTLTTFQSRVGWGEWLKPYTDLALKEMAKAGVSTVDVLCPGFAVDCLETLEEIAIQYANLFQAHGGQKLTYINSLNDSNDHVRLLYDIIVKNLADWHNAPPSSKTEQALAAERAKIMVLEKGT